MEFKVKPTFGAPQVETEVKPLEDKSFRPEVGAVWERQSRNNMDYLSIKLELTKEKLQTLLSKEGDIVRVNLVAFPNKTHNGNLNRPNFRIYEEIVKND